MPYRITKQYGRGPESNLTEHFKQLKAAQDFVGKHLSEEVAMNVQVIYRIYEFDELHSTYDASNIDTLVQADQTTSSGSINTSRPSPFSTTPKPPGVPNWKKDDKGEKDKE